MRPFQSYFNGVGGDFKRGKEAAVSAVVGYVTGERWMTPVVVFIAYTQRCIRERRRRRRRN